MNLPTVKIELGINELAAMQRALAYIVLSHNLPCSAAESADIKPTPGDVDFIATAMLPKLKAARHRWDLAYERKRNG